MYAEIDQLISENELLQLRPQNSAFAFDPSIKYCFRESHKLFSILMADNGDLIQSSNIIEKIEKVLMILNL